MLWFLLPKRFTLDQLDTPLRRAEYLELLEYSMRARYKGIRRLTLSHIAQFPSTVAPSELPFGNKKRSTHGTFGKPDGAMQPDTGVFLRSHAKEPVLPERKLSI